jgi:acetyltransferase-like isoleucine patch superfamily enzyme
MFKKIKDHLYRRIYLRILRAKKFVRYAQLCGVRMGKGCKFVSARGTNLGSEPYLITLGDHVEISANVTFVTHDGGIWVFREEYPEIDVFGPIKIGDNVFVGTNVTILPGSIIGNNCVVGAGALVRGVLQPDSVYAGIPVRRICALSEYKDKMISKSVPTKRMGSSEKRRYLEQQFPDYFVS